MLPIFGQEFWSLQKCIDYALEKNLQIESSDVAVRLSEIGINQAKHDRYPNLSLNTNVGWNFGRSIDPTRNEFITETFFNNGFTLSSGFTIYNGNRINNTISQSITDKKAAERDLDQVKRDIILNVASLYLSVLFEQENFRNAEVQLEQTKTQLSQIERLIEVGNRPENDRLDFESQIALNEQNLVNASNNFTMAILRLKQLLRLDPNTPFRPINPGNILVETDPDLVSFDELYLAALKSQPSVAASELRLQSAALGEKIAASAFYPTLGGRVSMNTNFSNKGIRLLGYETRQIEQTVTVNGTPVVIGSEQQVPILEQSPYAAQIDNNRSYGVGVGLSIPIYNNNLARNAVQRAKLGVINADLNLTQQKENLKITVGQAHADAKAAKARLNAANKSLMAQNNLYDNAQKRFDNGTQNTFELVRIKSLVESAEINALIAKYDYLFRLKVLDFYLGKPLKLGE
ncbi:MAG: TolC family protein [Saprospiraceae bacterium]|nr:TolC family protein [Saprospiraceae bacterium]